MPVAWTKDGSNAPKGRVLDDDLDRAREWAVPGEGVVHLDGLVCLVEVQVRDWIVCLALVLVPRWRAGRTEDPRSGSVGFCRRAQGDRRIAVSSRTAGNQQVSRVRGHGEGRVVVWTPR